MKKRNFVEQNKRQFNSRYPKSMPTSRQSSEPKTNQYFASSRDSLATSRQTSQKPQSYSKQIASPQNNQKVNAPKKVDIKLVDFVKAQESVQSSNDQQIPNQLQSIQLQLHDQQPFVEKTMKISVLEQNCGQVMEEQLEFSFSNLYSEKREKTIEGQESTKNQQKDNQVQSQKKMAKGNQNGQKQQQAVAQLHLANNRDNQTKSNCYYQISQMKQAIKQRQNSYNLQLQAKLGGSNDLMKQKSNQKQANQRKQAQPSPLQSPRSIQQQLSNNQKLEKSPKSDKQVKVTQL